MNGAARVADLFADLLTPQGTPAKAANSAKNEHPCGLAADFPTCEGLRKSANSQRFAGIRKPQNQAQSEHPCGFSQDSQDSQGVARDRAFAPRPVEPAARPYRLAPADADAAHAEAWDDRAIGRFVARVALLMRRGLDATDADDLAERLHLRDARADDRTLCLECVHLTGRPRAWRCSNYRLAQVARDVPDAIALRLQRCPGFAEPPQSTEAH